MNTKEKTLTGLVGVLSFAAIAPFAFGAVSDDSQNANTQRIMHGHGPRVGLSEEVRESIKDAFESGDYDAYVEFAQDNNLPHVMTESQFNERLEHHEEHQAVHEAVLSGDYETFRELMDDKAPQITEDNFDLLVAMAQAREDGDVDAIADAREALKDAGIGRPMMSEGYHGMRRGEKGERPDFASLTDAQKDAMKAQMGERRGNRDR